MISRYIYYLYIAVLKYNWKLEHINHICESPITIYAYGESEGGIFVCLPEDYKTKDKRVLVTRVDTHPNKRKE